MKIYPFFAALLLTPLVPSVQGAVLSYDVLWNPGVAEGSVGVLVVDTAGDGFAGIDTSAADLLGATLTEGSTLGADDFILDVAIASDGFVPGTFGFSGGSTFTLGDDGVTAGDSVALYWFDAPADTPVGEGQTFGFLQPAFDPASGGEAAWEVPGANNANIRLASLSADFTGDGGSLANAGFIANNGVVPIPEPSAGLLAALAGIGLLARRKRS